MICQLKLTMGYFAFSTNRVISLIKSLILFTIIKVTFFMEFLVTCVLEFDIALNWFEKLVDADPYRLEHMDTYSNILYIKECHGDLANLALRCFYNNKYSPEACCVVGNYYSLMGDHIKAVIYFRKAL